MDFGNITLEQLSRITDRNSLKAQRYGLKLHWQIFDGYLLAYISDNSHVCEQEEFKLDKHFHLVLAEIQYWYAQKLKEFEELF